MRDLLRGDGTVVGTGHDARDITADLDALTPRGIEHWYEAVD
jgi:hypothetical protein